MRYSPCSDSRVPGKCGAMRRKFTTAEVFLLFIGLPLLMLTMAACVLGIIFYFFG